MNKICLNQPFVLLHSHLLSCVGIIYVTSASPYVFHGIGPSDWSKILESRINVLDLSDETLSCGHVSIWPKLFVRHYLFHLALMGYKFPSFNVCE